MILTNHVVRNSVFCMCENKGTDHDHTFVFTTRIVQFIYFLNPNFPASSHLLCLYSLVYVGPGRKPQGWFSHDRAHSFWYFCLCPPLNHSSISGNTRSRSHVSGVKVTSITLKVKVRVSTCPS